MNTTIHVTYAPKTEGEYTATITCRAAGVDDIVITLHGASDYELYRPVMSQADEQYITSNSFRAEWTDNTPAENVTSYTLEVQAKPDVTLLSEGDWSGVPKDNTNIAANAADYLPDGWTFTGSNLYLDGGFLSPGRNSVIMVNCDLAGYTKLSIIVNAKAYTKGSNTTLDIATDQESKTITLAKEVETYLVVLEVGDHGFVKFTSGYYPEIQSIKIYGGEITDPEPFALRAGETGDTEYRLIEGITPDKFYTVDGLLPATSYLYRVKSLYVNGTESKWSNIKEVITAAGEGVRGDVDGNGTVTIDDVTLLIDTLLKGNGAGNAADVNLDGEVSIDDVTALIDYLLKGNW